MNKLVALILVSCALSLAGCATNSPGTQPWFAKFGEKSLSKRAAFDLSCPANQLQFSPLGNGNYDHKQVGVSGCGHKASYVLRENGNFINSEWIMNVASEQVPSRQP